MRSCYVLIVGFIAAGWPHDAVLIILGTYGVLIGAFIRIFANTYRSVTWRFHTARAIGVFIQRGPSGLIELFVHEVRPYLSVHIKQSVGGRWTNCWWSSAM